ncbi:RNA recognition motif containing protein [Fragilaria crotonensis]|nr:RNA recognition motif containing protein [Fragilaria crotonensis]
MFNSNTTSNNNGDALQTGRNDVYVGNLAFNTTEEQLSEVFSEVGRVVRVRMATDPETMNPRGFAFVEYQDPQAALSAIRNMNDFELNGRKIRVNFSNPSHLEPLAGKLGMDVPSSQALQKQDIGAGTLAVAEALKGMSKGELYDVIAGLKVISDRDPDEARRILSGHPQLQEAILFAMSKLDMVKTPVAVASAAVVAPVMPAPAPAAQIGGGTATAHASDPRFAAAHHQQSQQQQRVDPRVRVDPRSRDPRQRAAPPTSTVSNLDPALIQQVMSLTPQQIAQLPPDKYASIMALRNQILAGAAR